MNNSFSTDTGKPDGKPVLVTPDGVGLGLAIDLQNANGTRSLVVAAIKGADRMDFAQFWAAYEDIVRRARAGKLTTEDFQGTTISLTNPGGIGTVHSVPRPHAGRRRDHRRGRDGVPGRVPGRVRGDARPPRGQQDHHPDEHVRPPRHPGRAVR
jgi:hypothetical protein